MEQFSLERNSENDSQLEIVHRVCLEDILKDEPITCDYEIYLLNTIYPPSDPESIFETEEDYFLENWQTNERLVGLRANPCHEQNTFSKKRFLIQGACAAAGASLGTLIGSQFGDLSGALIGASAGGFLGYVLPEYKLFLDSVQSLKKTLKSKFVLSADHLQSAHRDKKSVILERMYLNQASGGKILIPDLCKLSFGKLDIEKDWSWLEDADLNECVRAYIMERTTPVLNKLFLDLGLEIFKKDANTNKIKYAKMLKDFAILLNSADIRILYNRLRINSSFNRLKKIPKPKEKSFFKGNLLVEYENTKFCQKEIVEIITEVLTKELSISSVYSTDLDLLCTIEKSNLPKTKKNRSLPIYLKNNKTGEETFGIVTLNLHPAPHIIKIRYGATRELACIEKTYENRQNES